MWFCFVLLLLVVLGVSGETKGSEIAFPLQLTADLTIIAHLVAEASEYPPRERYLSIAYDYTNKVARADIAKGFEAAKTYIRRYDEKQEYMVRPEPIEDCKRSYLGEVMPFPVVPDVTFAGEETVSGILCNHYIHIDVDTKVDVFMAKDTGGPVRLLQSSIDPDNASGEATAVLSYEYSNVQLGVPSIDMFDLPSPYTYTSCDNQIGGFPYLHIFHYFVKF